uniref:Trafficking protein particle complex subunit 2-like protein n=1 Tax=Ditylenchus dipsaci TaxID=166011 RepID=A0A915DKF9_9BILA
MALCVAIFDKDNTLLYLRVKKEELPNENDLHMFLTLFGIPLLNNSYRSYGYLTNTNVKFLLVVDASNNILKDHDVRAIFKRLHTNYCNAVANPFTLLECN